MPHSSSSRPKLDLWGPLRAEVAPYVSIGTGWWEAKARTDLAKNEGKRRWIHRGVWYCDNSHGGKDSVWMEKTGTLKLKWQEAVSPGSEVWSPALRVVTLQVLRQITPPTPDLLHVESSSWGIMNSFKMWTSFMNYSTLLVRSTFFPLDM